jgi:hypothetical protein
MAYETLCNREHSWNVPRCYSMQRIFFPLLVLSLVLAACSAGGLSTSTPPGNFTAIPTTAATEAPTEVVLPIHTRPVLPPEKLIATVSTPHIEQGPDGANTVVPSQPEGCAYQWASQELPELSAQFLQSLQQLHPEAQGRAFAFGENCSQANSRIIRFIPMETDFDVTLPVNDIMDKAELGGWVVKIMQVIDAIPPDQIMGPRPGRVSIGFASAGQQEALSFYIDQYHGLLPGLSNLEIYEALKAQ